MLVSRITKIDVKIPDVVKGKFEEYFNKWLVLYFIIFCVWCPVHY
jgi:hypothetical protein